jgi:hypothetical protein
MYIYTYIYIGEEENNDEDIEAAVEVISRNGLDIKERAVLAREKNRAGAASSGSKKILLEKKEEVTMLFLDSTARKNIHYNLYKTRDCLFYIIIG